MLTTCVVTTKWSETRTFTSTSHDSMRAKQWRCTGVMNSANEKGIVKETRSRKWGSSSHLCIEKGGGVIPIRDWCHIFLPACIGSMLVSLCMDASLGLFVISRSCVIVCDFVRWGWFTHTIKSTMLGVDKSRSSDMRWDSVERLHCPSRKAYATLTFPSSRLVLTEWSRRANRDNPKSGRKLVRELFWLRENDV